MLLSAKSSQQSENFYLSSIHILPTLYYIVTSASDSNIAFTQCVLYHYFARKFIIVKLVKGILTTNFWEIANEIEKAHFWEIADKYRSISGLTGIFHS